MATEAEKIAFLERVGYNWAMLNYTFMRVVTAQSSTPEEQLDGNAFLESFTVHARNLVYFLSTKSNKGDHNAIDYVTNFEAPDRTVLERPLSRLEKQILNVSTLGTADLQERFSIEDARELYRWIVPAILNFEGKLAPEYRVGLKALGSIDTSTANKREDLTSGP
jgi:hypothetical protein